MFDKDIYLQTIKHAACIAGEYESSEVNAFKIDDNDGLAKKIGFHAGMLNKVDYFLEQNNHVQLIELSDLEEDAQNCHAYIKKDLNDLKATIEKDAQEQGISERDVTIGEKSKIVSAAWNAKKIEFTKKWSGSIAVIERLYRKTDKPSDADPHYQLLIVCKNHTDIKMLEALKSQLSGMMGAVAVCDTQTLKSYIEKWQTAKR